MTLQLTSKMMQRTALRRLLASHRATRNNKYFHTSRCVAADALDMCDTFARRHCK